jgi:hypothetical protein
LKTSKATRYFYCYKISSLNDASSIKHSHLLANEKQLLKDPRLRFRNNNALLSSRNEREGRKTEKAQEGHFVIKKEREREREKMGRKDGEKDGT